MWEANRQIVGNDDTCNLHIKTQGSSGCSFPHHRLQVDWSWGPTSPLKRLAGPLRPRRGPHKKWVPRRQMVAGCASPWYRELRVWLGCKRSTASTSWPATIALLLETFPSFLDSTCSTVSWERELPSFLNLFPPSPPTDLRFSPQPTTTNNKGRPTFATSIGFEYKVPSRQFATSIIGSLLLYQPLGASPTSS